MEAAAATGTDPRSEMAHALLIQDAGDHDRARTLLREAVERHPGSADLVGALLGAELQRGDDVEALRWAEHLLALRPADVQITRVVRDLRARTSRPR